MIDPADLATLQAMQSKYQGAAAAIAEEKTKALVDVEDRYRKAASDLEDKRKAMIAQVERRSAADEARIGQFLNQLSGFLATLGVGVAEDSALKT